MVALNKIRLEQPDEEADNFFSELNVDADAVRPSGQNVVIAPVHTLVDSRMLPSASLSGHVAQKNCLAHHLCSQKAQTATGLPR